MIRLHDVIRSYARDQYRPKPDALKDLSRLRDASGSPFCVHDDHVDLVCGMRQDRAFQRFYKSSRRRVAIGRLGR